MTRFRDSLFQRLFAIIAFIASINLALELKGLFLKNGIVPFVLVKEQLEAASIFLPSFFLFQAQDTFIYLVLTTMILVLVLLASHVFRNRFFRASLLLVFYLAYLSFVNFGEPFMSFQWDALLLEMSFLFFLYFFLSQDDDLGKLNIWLFRILVFKLMLMSGLVKLLSGDKVWWDLSALEYHYYTQPLPNFIAFLVHQLPGWFHKLSCIIMFVVELIFPFFIFAGRRLREIAAWAFIVLQVIIFLTGNYGFFNLLTIVLCFSLFSFSETSQKEFKFKASFKYISMVILVLYSVLNLSIVATRFKMPMLFKKPAILYFKSLGALHLANPYGLFAMMTKKRGEIVIQGGRRVPGKLGIEWQDYEFKFKPQKLNAMPMQIAPLQPRLDWQMWFAALSDYKRNPWFVNLVKKLLNNEKDVTVLLAKNPFEKSKPDVIRALYYDYRFNDLDTYWKTKNIWQREYKGVYLKEASLQR